MSSFILTLIERGADLNAVDSRGRTPLFLACSSLHYEKIANCLIDMGASVQSPARFTCEPLMAAIEHSSERICLKLFRKGAMWSMNSYNITPHLLQKTIRNKRPMLATTILK
jgi:ankyrin repeat protein